MMQVTHTIFNEAVKITQPSDGYGWAPTGASRGGCPPTAGASSIWGRGRRRLPVPGAPASRSNPAVATTSLADRMPGERLGNRVRVLNTDIREMPPVLAAASTVVSNPPINSHGTRPRNEARAMAHMGDDTEMEDWVRAAVWAAKPRARITFICRADRVPELIALFDANGAGEAVLFPLWPRHSSPAGRVILQVRRDVRGPGAVLPGLVLHRDDGGFSDVAEPTRPGRRFRWSIGVAGEPRRRRRLRDRGLTPCCRACFSGAASARWCRSSGCPA